jgi:uncharacterized protein
MRNILIETGHPAQIHQFRNLACKLKEAGYRVLILARRKEISQQLLEAFQLDHVLLGRQAGGGILRKVLRLPGIYWQYINVLRQFKPDIILSRFSPQSSHLAWLFRIPHIGYTDSEFAKKLDAFTVPFVRTRITSAYYNRNLGKNHYRFLGNTELFYLHPNHYRPDSSVLDLLGVQEGEPYTIMRLVSWDAHHDVGHKGLSEDMKRYITEVISKRMKLFISSEAPLPPQLEQYRFTPPPHRMHDALALASLYVGEGITMASEAAMLGIPAILINPQTCGYLEDEASAGLVVSLRDETRLPATLEKFLATTDARKKARQLRDEYLLDKCDPTAFFFWLVSNYPGSLQALQANPAIALQFKS